MDERRDDARERCREHRLKIERAEGGREGGEQGWKDVFAAVKTDAPTTHEKSAFLRGSKVEKRGQGRESHVSKALQDRERRQHLLDQ